MKVFLQDKVAAHVPPHQPGTEGGSFATTATTAEWGRVRRTTAVSLTTAIMSFLYCILNENVYLL